MCWRIEHIRARQLEIHQAGVRDAVFTPLRNGRFCDFAQLGDLYCAAEAVDDLAAVEFHAQSIGNYTPASQAKLTQAGGFFLLFRFRYIDFCAYSSLYFTQRNIPRSRRPVTTEHVARGGKARTLDRA